MRIDFWQLCEVYIFSIGYSYQEGDLFSGNSGKDTSGARYSGTRTPVIPAAWIANLKPASAMGRH